MSKPDDHKVVIGKPSVGKDLLRILFIFVVVWLIFDIIGAILVSFIISIIELIGYTDVKIVEVSSKQLRTRRKIRWLGRVRSYNMDEIKAVRGLITGLSIGPVGGGRTRINHRLIIHFKDGTTQKVYIGEEIEKVKQEMSKYVEVLSPNYRDFF